jgi:hypothetical protein
MGWTYRKSVGVGPFRINLSKSGVGYSVGGMGFRTGVSSRGRRYKSFTIPGTGVRYYSSSKQEGCLLALALLSGIASTAVVLLIRILP